MAGRRSDFLVGCRGLTRKQTKAGTAYSRVLNGCVIPVRVIPAPHRLSGDLSRSTRSSRLWQRVADRKKRGFAMLAWGC